MVLGCSSDSGKSLLVTALCRWFARRGVDVVPFKAQNMSNNARVVAGGEIGVAQWLQAGAAGVEPTVDMNPVLLKPEADTRSQVIIDGVADAELTAMPWRSRGRRLWPAMTGAYDRLAAAHELVIIEGAGSPAEINLPDLVNNRMIDHAEAAGLLVADIDRGGAFAHLFGTWSLVPESTRARLAGFVLNKFRGDATLLAPAPAMLTERTGMASFGVLPMLDHRLPDEEGATVRATAPAGASTVAIVRYPYASNLDEWHLLPHAAHTRWATSPADLADADVVILPGSKHLGADADWLRRRGFDDEIRAVRRRGTRIVGVCGGAMFLGSRLRDPSGVEGRAGADRPGLGVIALETELAPDKTTVATEVHWGDTPSPWSALTGIVARGYEIRHGSVTGAATRVASGVWVDGNVLATTVHGLFEQPDVVAAIVGARPEPVLESTFELLADAVGAHLDGDALDRLVGLG
ncbi:MAG: cobyric acid synthase [Desertimonas sp.]